jgi:hypothetical protein
VARRIVQTTYEAVDYAADFGGIWQWNVLPTVLAIGDRVSGIGRRKFVAGHGSAAAWPPAAQTQPPAEARPVGRHGSSHHKLNEDQETFARRNTKFQNWA